MIIVKLNIWLLINFNQFFQHQSNSEKRFKKHYATLKNYFFLQKKEKRYKCNGINPVGTTEV